MPHEENPLTLPDGAIHLGTDPRGRVVWVSATTMDQHLRKHPEMRILEHSTDAVVNPFLIAQHPVYPQREIYIGHNRPPPDPAWAPARRILVVSTSTPGMLITGWDERRSELQTTIGTIVWKATGGT